VYRAASAPAMIRSPPVRSGRARRARRYWAIGSAVCAVGSKSANTERGLSVLDRIRAQGLDDVLPNIEAD
jgi:hypothetical protein